jgi:flagellar motor component MotA
LREKGEVFTKRYLKMGKKGVDGTPIEASQEVEIKALEARLQKMEDLMQE